jgi:uncharacterized protein with ACT and thioredoxin-like domain
MTAARLNLHCVPLTGEANISEANREVAAVFRASVLQDADLSRKS